MKPNPPEMTWKSILRMRMYDFLNAHSAHDTEDTKRGEEVIELAITDLTPYLKEEPN